MKSGEIDELIVLIAENFVFDEETYPELEGLGEAGRLAFAIRHSALHFSKTAGKIAAVSEDVDHGGDIDIESLRVDVGKSIINSLRFAELVGMTGEDIATFIRAKYS